MRNRRQEARDKRQETRSKRQETGDKRQEARDRRQETGDKRQETRSKRQETGDKKQETRMDALNIIPEKKWFLKNIFKKSLFLYVERSRNVQKNIKPLLIEYKFFALIFFVLPILLPSSFVFAQTDSLPQKPIIKKKQGQNPREAALRAAVLPGWGQLYNKKYWKLPLVYGGAAAIGYGIYWNNAQYQFFRNTYQEAFLSGNPQNINLQAAEVLRNQFRRNKEQLIIAGVVFYGLTIVDAIVDAHFSTYDVSDDLSLRWLPKIDFSPQGQSYLAFTLQLQRKK